MPNKSESKKKLENRLKRAEGQLRGIQTMIENDRECQDIITQLSAVRSSIDRIIGIIVAENLKDCLLNADLEDPIQSERIDQAIQLIVNK